MCVKVRVSGGPNKGRTWQCEKLREEVCRSFVMYEFWPDVLFTRGKQSAGMHHL